MTITTKENDIGILHKVELSESTILNIFTKKGGYRGGKSYNKDKFFTIISGEVEVTTFDGEKDIKNIYGPGQCIKIEAGVPNIFYFTENCEMLEWFSKDVETKKYERYGKLKK